MLTKKERDILQCYSFTDFEGNHYKYISNAYYVLYRDSGNWPGYSKNGKSISKQQFRNDLAQTIKKYRKRKRNKQIR